MTHSEFRNFSKNVSGCGQALKMKKVSLMKKKVKGAEKDAQKKIAKAHATKMTKQCTSFSRISKFLHLRIFIIVC